MIRVILLQCAVSVLMIGCFQEYSQENPQCPCEDGWRCCLYTDTCIQEDQSCESEDYEGSTNGKDGGSPGDSGAWDGNSGGDPWNDRADPDEPGAEDGDGGGRDVLIARRSSGCGMGGWPSTDQVAIYLAYGFYPEDCLGVIGWDTPHSGPGTVVYDSKNEPGFDDLVTCLTNGVDDSLNEGTMFYPDGNGAAGSFNESEFWHKRPDLAGCTITRIRHVISSLTFTFDSGGGANVDGEWVWEVWGTCEP